MFNPKNRVDVSDSFETMSQIHSETTLRDRVRWRGRGGIRTLGGFNPTAAFQATALNRYATRPKTAIPANARGKRRTVGQACVRAKQDFWASHGGYYLRLAGRPG